MFSTSSESAASLSRGGPYRPQSRELKSFKYLPPSFSLLIPSDPLMRTHEPFFFSPRDTFLSLIGDPTHFFLQYSTSPFYPSRNSPFRTHSSFYLYKKEELLPFWLLVSIFKFPYRPLFRSLVLILTPSFFFLSSELGPFFFQFSRPSFSSYQLTPPPSSLGFDRPRRSSFHFFAFFPIVADFFSFHDFP